MIKRVSEKQIFGFTTIFGLVVLLIVGCLVNQSVDIPYDRTNASVSFQY